MNVLCKTRHAIAGIVLCCSAAGFVRAGEMRNASGIPERGTRGGAPGVDLKQVVIWGSTCKQPEGEGLAFGGQDQRASDGRPHTRILRDGDWIRIDEELRKRNPL
jgi:hypothetical protein